jgi:hypothetical protein
MIYLPIIGGDKMRFGGWSLLLALVRPVSFINMLIVGAQAWLRKNQLSLFGYVFWLSFDRVQKCSEVYVIAVETYSILMCLYHAL